MNPFASLDGTPAFLDPEDVVDIPRGYITVPEAARLLFDMYLPELLFGSLNQYVPCMVKFVDGKAIGVSRRMFLDQRQLRLRTKRVVIPLSGDWNAKNFARVQKGSGQFYLQPPSHRTSDQKTSAATPRASR